MALRVVGSRTRVAVELSSSIFGEGRVWAKAKSLERDNGQGPQEGCGWGYV